MKITRNTGELAPGTVVELPDGEVLEIVEYIEATARYRVRFLEFDGVEFLPIGGERVIGAYELIGGETGEP